MKNENPGVGQPVDENAVRQAALAAERQRQKEIKELAAPFATQLGAEFIDKLLFADVTVEMANTRILTELAKKSAEQPQIRSGITMGLDARDKMRVALGAALEHRVNPAVKVEDDARQYCSFSLVEMARHCLEAAGVNTKLMPRVQIAEAALGLDRTHLAGMHSTGDFPYILANVANKSLIGAYDYAKPTYRAWTKPSTAPDFKTMSRLRLGETPALELVKEGGVINLGTMTESREQYALATYGKRVAVTRQMIINDDLGAFSQIIPQMGVQVSRLENATVYAILNANAAMGDSVTLFHSTHGNLAGSNGAISISTLDVARAAMMVQKGLDGVAVLNITPRFLLVPAAKKTVAQQYTDAAGILVATQANKNPFAGALEVIADAELDGTSTTAWYLAADPMMGTIEYAFLEGSSGPRIVTKEGWEVEGIEFKVVHDFGAKAVDWRGLYKNAGA